MERPPNRPARFGLILAVLLGLGLTLPVGPIARADSVAQAEAASRQAKAQARAASAKVDALLDRYNQASASVTQGVGQLSQAFASAASADVTSEEAAEQDRRARAMQRRQVLNVYASGGTVGVVASVLGAESADDALWRASTAGRIMGSVLAKARSSADITADIAAVADRRAVVADAATSQQAAALETLQHRQKNAAAALEQAEQALTSLSSTARKARVAVAAARRIAAAEAAARAAQSQAAGSVSALAIPPIYLTDYQAAAKTCPGMSWTLLAAVGQVESGHGRNVGPSSAGAIGPMQFMPGTFASYAVDGDGSGTKDAWDPEDAIFTAAHYLCVLGAEGGSTDGIQRALFGYNHAQWYVDLVLSAQNAIAEQA